MGETKELAGNEYYLNVFVDPENGRVRIDDFRGSTEKILVKAEELCKENGAEKLIVKGRSEQLATLLKYGYQLEATVDRYFLGSDAYFFCKYFSSARSCSESWITEDSIIKSVYVLGNSEQTIRLPKEYQLKRIAEKDSEVLAALYKQVFQVYPTPLNDPEYVRKTMKDGTVYFGYFFKGEIVSAASAEINTFYKNAELTDCATLIKHRKHGLMKVLLQRLERELKENGIFCAYSIARSLSFGMNAALYQLGYEYRGRLKNNCYIYDKLEDMNMWVKNLS